MTYELTTAAQRAAVQAGLGLFQASNGDLVGVPAPAQAVGYNVRTFHSTFDREKITLFNVPRGSGLNLSTGTGTASESAGVVSLTGSSTGNEGKWQIAMPNLTVGRKYTVHFTQVGANSFNGVFTGGGQSGVIVSANQAAGSRYITFTATATINYIVFNTVSTGGSVTISDITITASDQTAGYEWYGWNFFSNPYPRSRDVVSNADGSLTITGGSGGTLNGQIATAAQTTPTNWVGKAFGGGAYFEAEIKFDNTAVNTVNGWPSFWSMDIEHLALTGGSQWPGQAPGYEHWAEFDFFEYLITGYGANVYGGNLHDWYGSPGSVSEVTLPFSEVRRSAPTATIWNNYHTVGGLWVPATPTTPGYASFWFNRQQLGPAKSWTLFNVNSAPPPNPAFGIMDSRHMVPIIGSGLSAPITVRSLSIWQVDDSQNISR